MDPGNLKASLLNKVFILSLIFLPACSYAQEAPRLFDFWQYYSDAENTLYKYFCSEAWGHLADRQQSVAALHRSVDWERHQQRIRDKFRMMIGPLPEKTSLNAKITGRLKGDGFSVEKIVYESLPGFPVTAALFLPKKITGKAPAIIYCSGHTSNGFRSETYQHVIINLVKKGFIVFAFDPIGQGERLQYYDPAKGASIFGPTHEHSYPGAQCFVTGYSPALYFVWDGIRAVDYLVSRREVDPDRIGITGRSGGGTQSSFIGAVDQRILAAAPENFVTNYESLLRSKGPQDGEQNFYHALAEGFDHADLLVARAPKPTMLVTTTRDMFSIHGVRETYGEAQKAFAALGSAENLSMVEDHAGHESTLSNREALYAFFQKHLGNPGSAIDEAVTVFSDQDLMISGSGNLYPNSEYEDIYSLNKRVAGEKIERIKTRRKDIGGMSRDLKTSVPMLSGYEAMIKAPRPVYSGSTRYDKCIQHAYLVKGSGDYWIPVLITAPLLEPAGSILYLSDQGKAETATPVKLAEKGFVVVTADLPGFGELGPGYLKGDAYIQGVSLNQWFAGMLVNRSITGLWASDMAALLSLMQNQYPEAGKSTILMSKGIVGPAALHAAFLDQSSFHRLVMISSPVSYADLVITRDYQANLMVSAVPGVLEAYDLPDIMGGLSQKKILLINPLRANGLEADRRYMDEEIVGVVEGSTAEVDIIMESGHSEQDTFTEMLNWITRE